MLVIVGTVIVIVAVVGGYAIPGGHLDVLWQPFEFMSMVGDALGALVISNTKVILGGVATALAGRLVRGHMPRKRIMWDGSRLLR